MAAGRAFGRWHLKGGRYEQNGLPVEMLSEFASYERLVVDVARAIYKSRHARRTRVPRGFASGFELRLTDVQTGSVVPVLEVPADSGLGLVGTDVVGVFDEARILIQSTLRAVSVGEDIPRSFPPQALREFSRFGRSLRDGESIEFDEGTSDAATYSQSIRRMLQERAKLDRFEVETLVVGQVVGLLADKAAFEFRLAENGRTVPGRFFSDEVLPDLKEYLDASTMASTVAISAVVITSMTDSIVEISDVLSIEPVLPPDWSGRLKALSELRDGWFDGSGGKIDRHVLRATESLLLECLDAGIARPGMYPTEDSGVRLEWAMDDREVTVDVRADRTVTIFAFSKLNDDEIELAAQWHEVDEVVDFISGGSVTDSPQRHELHTGEHVLTAPTELLWRQIHPSHVDGGKVSSLAFTPSAKDEGQLSTTRSTKASADEAYAHYTKVRGLSSFGVYAVTVAEVDDQGLRAVDDSGVATAEPTPGHAYIDFRDVTSANRRKKIAARLRDRAEQRGWQNH